MGSLCQVRRRAVSRVLVGDSLGWTASGCWSDYQLWTSSWVYWVRFSVVRDNVGLLVKVSANGVFRLKITCV